MNKFGMKKILIIAALVGLTLPMAAQKYPAGLIDKTIAVVGNEAITITDIEDNIQMERANGVFQDAEESRCRILESLMDQKIFLVQARIDSISVNASMTEAELNQRIDNIRTMLGGDDKVAEYFGKSVFRLRQEWGTQLQDLQLVQQAQSNIASKIPEITPYDVKQYLDTANVANLPIVPIKYKYSQICLYPDRDSAALACKEKLLAIRERIMNGEKFATMARLYSEDGSARKGGELGMASKSIFWPAFSDAAMALKPGNVSQVVETPDGFHLIEVIEKKGDMFNARHILIKPAYTSEDKEKAFRRLDSLRNHIMEGNLNFDLAAKIYSQDPATRTNGGQVADPNTGSASFDIDQLKPQDYTALQDLQPGEISKPIVSLDNEGRDGNLVYKIIRLDQIVPAHTATLEHDYTDLLTSVKVAKQNKAINDFVDKKIGETNIVIDPIFKDCNFSREGWTSKVRKD